MNDDELTAYHEAGHAVIATVEGGRVDGLSMIPESDEADSDAVQLGNTKILWPMRGLTAKQHAVREIRTALAGPAAERIHAGDAGELRISKSSSGDWLYASDLAQPFMSNRAQRTSLLMSMSGEIESLLRQDSVWAAVAAIADELLAHEALGTEQVQETLDFWIGRMER